MRLRRLRKRSSASHVLVVLVTCPTRAVGRRIAAQLVRQHLTACVNILPGIESLFWWKGKVDRCPEVLLVIKSTRASFGRLKAAVLLAHPYELPEVIALPVTAGHAPYLRWVRASLAPSKNSPTP